MRHYIWIFLFIFLFTVFLRPQKTFSSSSYVLPYPSYMPGNIFYKVHLFIEGAMKYWYFGNLSQFTYNLKQADKYLVEAKTLFEYNQYLLGVNALLKSDFYFKNVNIYLNKAQAEKKDIQTYTLLLQEASQKHQEVLTTLKNNVPISIVWRPEKQPASELKLEELLNSALIIRTIN